MEAKCPTRKQSFQAGDQERAQNIGIVGIRRSRRDSILFVGRCAYRISRVSLGSDSQADCKGWYRFLGKPFHLT